MSNIISFLGYKNDTGKANCRLCDDLFTFYYYIHTIYYIRTIGRYMAHLAHLGTYYRFIGT